MAALGRRDAGLVKEYTETDAAWGKGVRSRFLQNHWIAYQVPVALPCDRTMVFDALDGLYLEGMLQFLTGKRALPMSVDSRFWAFDLPVPSQAGERTEYDYLRTQWSVSYGFGYVISFADHDALRVDESPQVRYDVITVANPRQTQHGTAYRCLAFRSYRNGFWGWACRAAYLLSSLVYCYITAPKSKNRTGSVPTQAAYSTPFVWRWLGPLPTRWISISGARKSFG